MKNITKNTYWQSLKDMGFAPVRFVEHGKHVGTGAEMTLPKESLPNTFLIGSTITIEPRDGRRITSDTESPDWMISHPNGYMYVSGRNVLKHINKIKKDLSILKSYYK